MILLTRRVWTLTSEPWETWVVEWKTCGGVSRELFDNFGDALEFWTQMGLDLKREEVVDG